MASNSFGGNFRITTFGESHGSVMGVVIDGCSSGIDVCEADINKELALRSPGKNKYVSPRVEKDEAQILSGVFEGKTTGAPIAIIIANNNADSSKYESIKDLLRPGHANYTYLKKYGFFDYRGGGRASARETVCRVAAGAVAKKILVKHDIAIVAYIKSIGSITAEVPTVDIQSLRDQTYQNPIYCPDEKATVLMMQEIDAIRSDGDSIGGTVEFMISGAPAGLGDPVYEKLDANLAKAMMSIPATKGFEIGSGFAAAAMKGSEHNDVFVSKNGEISTETNNAGGVLGGISTGMPITGRVAFKPTPSIMTPQKTIDIDGKEQTLQLPAGSRHDPCVAIRAVPVVEAMCALVIVDQFLLTPLNK